MDRDRGDAGVLPARAVVDEKPDEFGAAVAAQVAAVSGRKLDRDGGFEKIGFRVEADARELLVRGVADDLVYGLERAVRQVSEVIEVACKERFEFFPLRSIFSSVQLIFRFFGHDLPLVS